MSIQNIMTADQSGKELVEFADRVAERLVRDGLTRAQIRNIFSEVRQIEAMWHGERSAEALRRLNMLKPKLAYLEKRTKEAAHLKEVLTDAIEQVNKADSDHQEEAFGRFVDFFEAILAYHHARGGRK
jgi:CRISPR-associated protein Csm2